MKIVKFTKRYQRYNAGEVAGFPDIEAGNLIKFGVAVLNASAASAAVPKTEGREKAAETKRNRQETAAETKRNRQR